MGCKAHKKYGVFGESKILDALDSVDVISERRAVVWTEETPEPFESLLTQGVQVSFCMPRGLVVCVGRWVMVWWRHLDGWVLRIDVSKVYEGLE